MTTVGSASWSTLDARRRSVILLTCCLSVFVAGIDVTIVNVALPSIQRSLHTTVSGLQWTIDAYTLGIACLLMLSGSLADRFGRRRVFQIGLALFSLGSLPRSIAPSLAPRRMGSPLRLRNRGPAAGPTLDWKLGAGERAPQR